MKYSLFKKDGPRRLEGGTYRHPIIYFENSTKKDKGNPLGTSPLNSRHLFTKLRLKENNLDRKQKEPRHASY